MRYRKLGTTTCLVSEVGMGTWLTTYDPAVDMKDAIACVSAAIDHGINLIDTANIYGFGAAEKFLGRALGGFPRDKVVLATKVYFPMTDSDRGLSGSQIAKQLDASLTRLKTDYIDLYQCHRFDPETSIEETMDALNRAVAAGKVRFIGFSEWPVQAIREAMSVGGEPFVSSQPQYSLLCRRPETEIFPLCAGYGISQITYSPLAQGVLTGKYRPGEPLPTAGRACSPTMGKYFRRELLVPEVLEAVQRVRQLAADINLTLAQFCLAWVLRREEVSSVLIGATSAKQLTENLKASQARIDQDLFAEAESILAPFHNASR